VEEVYTSEGTRRNGIDGITSTFQLNLSVAADVGEDVALAHFNERKLNVVAVGEEVCFRLDILRCPSYELM
jgi:hypothetical protein